MLKIVDRTPSFQPDELHSHPVSPKKAIKISSQKLPRDFFRENRNTYCTSVLLSRSERQK